MNIISIILILIIGLSVIHGIVKGFIFSFTSLVSLLVSILLMFLLYPYAVELFKIIIGDNHWIMPLSIFISLLFTGSISSFLFNLVLAPIPDQVHDNPLNKIAGALPGALTGLLYAAVVSLLLFLFPFSEAIINKTRSSVVAQHLSLQLEQLEKRLNPELKDAISRTMQLTTVQQGSTESLKLTFVVQDPKVRSDLELAMVDLINEERLEHGLGLLEADSPLTEVARDHSRDMLARAYFSHISPEGSSPSDRVRSSGIYFLTVGENLAFAQTVAIAHEGLMNSPGHRANILNPAFGKVGIGILDGGIYGLMITQNFKN